MFYVPNIIGYIRFALAFTGMYTYHNQNTWHIAVWAFVFSQLIDTIDGTCARKLNQTSKLGAVLDLTADRATSGFAFLTFMAEL